MNTKCDGKSKIRSDGIGRGLGIGQGQGPLVDANTRGKRRKFLNNILNMKKKV